MNNKTILKRLFFLAFTILVSNISMAQNDDLGTSQDQPFPECTTPKKLKIKVDGKNASNQKINNKPLYELCYGETLTLSQSEDITPDQTEWASPDFAGYAIKWFEGVESTRLLNMSNAQVVLNGKVNEHTITYDDSYIGVDELPVVLYAVDALYLDGSCKTSDTVYIKFNPVPTAKYRDDHPEFCEGKAAGAVSLDFVGGVESDYTIRWYSGTDIATGSSIGVDLGVDFFKKLKADIHEFVYKLIDKETGCESEEQSYTVTVYPVPEAPEETTVQYTINGYNRWLLTKDDLELGTGYDLVWFDNLTDADSRGSIDGVTVDRAQAGEKTVYIAYKDGECYSERAKVTVEVLSAPVPSVRDIDLCKDGTYDAMDGISSVDEGYDLIWFVDPTDTVGKALPTPPATTVDVTTPGKYTYYVAQRMKTAPYVQSDVVSFDVIVYGVDQPLDASKHEYCANDVAEPLKADLVEDHAKFLYASDVEYRPAGTAAWGSALTPMTATSVTQSYEFEAVQKYKIPNSTEVCYGDPITISVNVTAVEAPNVSPVRYSKSEAVNKVFDDILTKYPEAIVDVPGQTLTWALEEDAPYRPGSTMNSKPFYDETVPDGEVEFQLRWVRWEKQVSSDLTCKSKPSKIDITISSTPAPIVNPVAMCEADYTAGTIPGGKNLEDFVEINDYNGMMNATDYQLYWYTDKAKAEAAIKNGPSEGSATAPALRSISIDMTTEPMASKWEGEVYVVQSDGVTTSPASSMRITVNASPRLLAMPHGPVCMGPVDLTSAEYWVIDNVIAATVQYTFNGSVVENPKAITQSGEYEITATSPYGCVSDPLSLQVDIRNLSIEMAAMSMTCPGGNVYSQVEIDYSYNKDSYAAPELSWTSKERGSTKPTQTGIITSADKTSFAYISGDFNGVAGDIHTISITITDGYCTATADQKVTIGDGPVEGYFSWNEPNNMSVTNGSTLMLSELNKDKFIINACGDAVTVDFSKVMRDGNSDIEWYSDPNFSKPIATGDSKTFNAKEYGKYYIRYPNGCYASASFEIVDASVEILTISDGVVKLNEKESYSKEIMVSSAVSPLSFAWYKDGEPFINNSDVLTFKSLNVANSGLYTIEYHSGACSAKLDVVDLKVIELDNAVISISANDPDEIINVYTISGTLVKSNVKRSEALNGLANGAYVIGRQKVVVNK